VPRGLSVGGFEICRIDNGVATLLELIASDQFATLDIRFTCGAWYF